MGAAIHEKLGDRFNEWTVVIHVQNIVCDKCPIRSKSLDDLDLSSEWLVEMKAIVSYFIKQFGWSGSASRIVHN